MPCNISVKALEIKKSRERARVKLGEIPSHSGMDSPFLNLGCFLISISLEVLHSQTSWRFTKTLQTSPEIVPDQVGPSSQASYNEEMLAENQTAGSSAVYSVMPETFPNDSRKPFIQNSSLEISSV